MSASEIAVCIRVVFRALGIGLNWEFGKAKEKERTLEGLAASRGLRPITRHRPLPTISLTASVDWRMHKKAAAAALKLKEAWFRTIDPTPRKMSQSLRA